MTRLATVLATSVAILTLTTANAQSNDVQAVVDFHNKVRNDIGAGPLKYSPVLAKAAQAWAEKLAETGEIGHSGKAGENVAFNSTLLGGAEMWYSEIKKYKPGTRVDNKNYQIFGHYTQMVWKKSTEIGIGMAVIKKGKYKSLLAIVANYDPPGNYVGDLPY